MVHTAAANGRLALVIEADAALRHIVTLGLRQRGLRVLATPSLRIAWELLDEAPAIVVLDIGVGATSEWMWPRLLRRHRLLRAVPTVLLAWECPVAEGAALAPGREETPTRVCLAKPFDARALYAAVDELLATSALADPPTASAIPTTPAPEMPEHALLATQAPQSMRAPTPAPGPLLTAEIAEPPAGAVADLLLTMSATPDQHADATQPAPAPSVWPLLAAGTATLATVGFLIRPVYAVIGLALFILVALRWSTALVRPTP